MMMERVGSYYYLFPKYKQGRRIIWEGMDRDGTPFLSHFPKELLDGKPNDTEMRLKYKNGSILRVVGTDEIDWVVGANPIVCVFSEYPLQNPKGWDYLRPILAENGGTAIFDFTPRGKNHGYTLYNSAKDNPNWFCQLLTVDDTHHLSQAVLEQEKQEIKDTTGDEALFYQEYYCNFDVPIQGSYYGKLLQEAETTGRICNVPIDPVLPVHTAWDLGVGDSTAIWFYQMVGQEVRIVDYYATSGEGLDHYAKVLQERNYLYGEHLAPHDIEVRELGSGKSRLEIAASLGINFKVCPNIPIEDGINSVRMLLPKCWFDKQKCEKGLEALRSYHKEWDEDNRMFKNHPEHDWASDGADGFRYLAVGYHKEYDSYILPKKNWAIA